MKLRTRLSLGFTLLAVLPAAVIGWATLRTVTAAFESMFESRLSDAERTVRSEVERTSAETTATASALATTSPAVRQLARDLYLGEADLAALVPLAEGLMVGRDLGVLFLLDADGRVLSSGHLPARFGYAEPELLRLAAEAPDTTVLREVEVRSGDRILRRPALLTGRPVVYGGDGAPGLHVVAGRLLDEAFVARLRDLSGSRVSLLSADGETLAEAAPPAATPPSLFGMPVRLPSTGPSLTRRIPLPAPSGEQAAEIDVAVDDTPLTGARAAILLTVLVAGLGGLVGAVLLGGLLAGRITRPVDALASAAVRVGRGDYEGRVDTPASGELERLVAAFNAMTEEIRHSRDRIAKAERIAAWQEIARRLAHEIKNPLTPISTSIETLQRTWERQHPQFEEIFQESTQAMLEEVGALRRIVDEFSRFARLPAPSPQPTAPADLVDATLALFPEPPDGISLLREVEDDLPRVSVDRDQLQQVLLNLVTNAVQSIQHAARPGTVRLRASSADGELRLEVHDDGPGISESALAELFTPYFTTKDEGTGLGLAICHRIVAEHHGRIDVRSTPEAGTTFSVFLPAAS